MTYIVDIFTVHSDPKLIEIINSILTCYPDFIDDYNKDLMLTLIDKTVEKILWSLSNVQQLDNLTHNKSFECWNMLPEIVKNKVIMANFGVFIEGKL